MKWQRFSGVGRGWTLGLLWPCVAFGQLGVKLETDRAKYVRYEPVKCQLTLRNYSGNSLVFSAEEGRGDLHFVVVAGEEREARAIDPDANPVAGLILGAGETRKLQLVLNALYDMQKEGVYTIYAQVGHPRLKDDFRTDHVVIEIRDGLPLWSRKVGMPGTDTVDPIQPRTVTLLMFNGKDGDEYCMRVEDGDLVYGLARLGRRIAGGKPECDVDAVSNVHALLQIRSRLYAYHVYDLNLALKQTRFYMPDQTLPHLVRDPDIGRIMVVGGRVAVEGVDYFRTGGQVATEPRRARAPESAPPPE